ncbi:putative phosphoesterase [hydrothermal vent metagenome]|uniref:Putative phosphoesterase n=1 Tax=hydrothermal vent metagenome TaxID=652676 RepID=A0A1W1EIP7_9ZZZZ
MLKTVIFPTLLSILFIGIHYLFYSRVLTHLHIKDNIKQLFRYLTVLNFIGVLGYIVARYYITISNTLYYIFSLTIGIGFVILISVILYEILHLLQRNIPIDKSKRAFFKKSSDIGFIALGVGYGVAGIIGGSKKPILINIDVKQNHFKKPYKIAQISDMHIGGLIDREFVKDSVDIINAQKPDMVVITGDLVDANIDELKDSVDELKNLKSKFGTFFVVGNHEYFHQIENTLLYLKSIGIKVLENSAIKVEDFYIVGVYDVFGYRYGSYIPNIKKATKDIPKNMPTLLLAHQPKYIKFLENFKPSLILSGHTHGGQIWPFGHLVKLDQGYLRGLHKIDRNRHIYINSGIGFWGPPMRLASTAEITIINWS